LLSRSRASTKANIFLKKIFSQRKEILKEIFSQKKRNPEENLFPKKRKNKP